MTPLTAKRFKILSLLALQVGVWEDKMEELANALDFGHPDTLKALAFYEDKIIEVLSMKEEPILK